MPAKYLERIISKSVSGFVNNNSMVPLFFSSAKLRMVMAGIKKRYTQGAIINKPSKEEYPLSSTLNSPGKTHRNRLTMSKNTIITT
jgi:hypothetical protein